MLSSRRGRSLLLLLGRLLLLLLLLLLRWSLLLIHRLPVAARSAPLTNHCGNPLASACLLQRLLRPVPLLVLQMLLRPGPVLAH